MAEQIDPDLASLYGIAARVVATLRREGIRPVLYGSAGVARYIRQPRPPADVDFLVPAELVGTAWPRLRAVMEVLGFWVSDEHEHEFTCSSGAKVAFAPDGLREDGIVIDSSDLVELDLGPETVVTLSAKAFRRAYQISVQDSWRTKDQRDRDDEMIKMLTAYLDDASREKVTFRIDDLSSEQTRALIALHLDRMHGTSPPESAHALDVDGLRRDDVTFWCAWLGEELVGCGALKRLDAQNGELKSMRVVDAFLGQGYGRALLEHLVVQASVRGMKSLWLETGSGEVFEPAIRLYESAGFVRCGPFGEYIEDPFSVFMTKTV